MSFNLTKEIPELAFLIEYSERIEQAEHMLRTLHEVQQDAALKALEKLNKYENKHDIWFGEDLIIEFLDKQFLIKGLNDNENERLKVRQIHHVINIKDKQTKGTEGEKEKS